MASAIGGLLGNGNILSTALNVASMVFPQAALASTIGNVVSQAVGSAVNQAVGQLCKESGMPKFLQDMIGKLVDQVLQQQHQPSDSGCDQHVQDRCGSDVTDFIHDLASKIADATKGAKQQDGGDDSSGSWLVALAKALGKVAGQHAQRVAELSNKMESLDGKDPSQANEAMQTQTELQGESQMLNLLMTSFSSTIKSIGEAAKTMGGRN